MTQSHAERHAPAHRWLRAAGRRAVGGLGLTCHSQGAGARRQRWPQRVGPGTLPTEVEMGVKSRYIELFVLGEEGHHLERFRMAGSRVRPGIVTPHTPVVATMDAVRRLSAEILQGLGPGQLANNCERTTRMASQS